MVTRLYRYQFGIRKGLILNYNDGWGEIAPLEGLSKETYTQAEEEILSLLPYLSTAKPKLASVQFGLQCAKTPFVLKPLKIPFCAFQTPQKNNPFLKIKVGHLKVDEAIKFVGQYHLNYRLRIDCNKKWSLEEALFFADHFSKNAFDYMEDPVNDFEDLIQFTKKTKFPVVVDTPLEKLRLNQIPTLKAIVLKPMIQGFIPNSSFPIILSSTYETSLGHLLIARYASQNTLPVGLGTFTLCSDNILKNPLNASGPFLHWTPSQSPICTSELCLIAHVP
jgi:O-succinylbenzoate synthase